jgi:hypothetical protein
MCALGNEPVRNLNTFIAEQRLVGEFLFTLVLFSHGVETVYNNISSNNIPEFTYQQYRVGGATALYDAIGSVISSETDDENNDVICVILTDGEENSSRTYTKNQISTMIKNKEEKGWVFHFLAANQDAFAVGTSMGISNNMNFEYTPQGYSSAMQSVSISISGLRNLIINSGTAQPIHPTPTTSTSSIASVSYSEKISSIPLP